MTGYVLSPRLGAGTHDVIPGTAGEAVKLITTGAVMKDPGWREKGKIRRARPCRPEKQSQVKMNARHRFTVLDML
jgi:hypothetical protein